jgi:hypothetical protein
MYAQGEGSQKVIRAKLYGHLYFYGVLFIILKVKMIHLEFNHEESSFCEIFIYIFFIKLFKVVSKKGLYSIVFNIN